MNPKAISKVMAELGKRTSDKKAAASRENGKLGGRPRKPKVIQEGELQNGSPKASKKRGRK